MRKTLSYAAARGEMKMLLARLEGIWLRLSLPQAKIGVCFLAVHFFALQCYVKQRTFKFSIPERFANLFPLSSLPLAFDLWHRVQFSKKREREKGTVGNLWFPLPYHWYFKREESMCVTWQRVMAAKNGHEAPTFLVFFAGWGNFWQAATTDIRWCGLAEGNKKLFQPQNNLVVNKVTRASSLRLSSFLAGSFTWQPG